jgi:hypothetical protein
MYCVEKTSLHPDQREGLREGARVKFAIVCAIVSASFLLPTTATGLEDRHEVPSAPAVVTASAATAATTPVPFASVSVPSFATALAPTAPVPAIAFTPAANAFIVLKTPPQHKFFDTRNTFGLTAMAASLTADALSTQKGLAYPGFHEMNPIARPFVQTRAGAAAYSAGSFALLAGAMYAAHKTRHHKLEHIFPFAVAGWEAGLSARNYHVIATHR